MAQTSSRLTSAPVLAGALIVVTALAAGPLQPVDAALQGYWAKRYTPNWSDFLDAVPNAVAGQAVCLPVLLAVAVTIAWRRRTWHPIAIVAATEAAFYGGVGGMKVLLGRTSPAAGEGVFWQGGVLEHGWYGIAYPSGHAAEAVLIYGAAAYLLRTYAGPEVRLRARLNWAVGLITVNAIVVAFYLGYHWPTDLVGGMLAGGLLLRVIVDVDRHLAAGGAVLGLRLRSSATPVAARPTGVLAPLPGPVPAPARAPVAPRPTFSRASLVAQPPGPEQLPDLQPAASTPLDPAGIRSRWEHPRATPFVVRSRRPAHRTRELQTSGRG